MKDEKRRTKERESGLRGMCKGAGRKARLTAAVLAFAMTAGLFTPFAAGGAGSMTAYAASDSVNAEVTIVSQTGGQFVHERQTVTVNSELAESYGYEDKIDSAKAVSALDVLVKAHELALGSEFAKENAEQYLSFSDGGAADSFFGREQEVFGFAVNGIRANTGVKLGSHGYDGTALGGSVIHDGDIAEFFTYTEKNLRTDWYTWFEINGIRTDTIYAEVGDELALTLNGYVFAWLGSSSASEIEDSTEALTKIEVYANGDTLLGTTDENTGEITISFSEAGEYTLSVPVGSGQESYIMPNMKIITVDTLTDAQKAENAARSLCWNDIRGENGSIYNVGKNLTLPTSVPVIGAAGEEAQVTWKSSKTSCIKNTGVVTPGKADEPVTLTATVTVGGASVSKQFNMQVYAGGAKDITARSDKAQLEEITEITNALAVNETAAALEPKLFLNRDFLIGYLASGGTLTAEQKTAVLRQVQIDANADMSSSILGFLCKDALVLCALGIDPSETARIIDKISEANPSNLTIYNAPYVLMVYAANEKCAPKSDAALSKDTVIRYILDNQEKSGEKKGSFGGNFADAGNTASVILGFAGYTDHESADIKNSEITAAIDAAYEYIVRVQGVLGDFGDANSNSYAVLAGAMLGRNPQELTKGAGYPDVIDALLADSLGAGKGFKYAKSEADLMATADAMRALAAFENYIDGDETTKGNIYDFTDKELIAEENMPGGKTLTDLFVSPPKKTSYKIGESLDTTGMTVTAKYSDGSTKVLAEGEYTIGTFSNKKAGAANIKITYTETAYGITESRSASFTVNVVAASGGSGSGGGSGSAAEKKAETTVKNADGKILAQGSTVIGSSTTVIDALKQVLASAGITATIKDGSYVVSIDGLGEFDMGGNSGWMVRVDGVLIETSAAKYKLKGGEQIEWFYTKDYTKVPGAGGSGSASVIAPANKEAGEAAEKARAFIQNSYKKSEPYHAAAGEEWVLLGHVRGEGKDRVSAAYKEGYIAEAEAAAKKSGGVLDARRVTENARTIIALTAVRKDAEKAGGQNLLMQLSDMENVTRQGVNGAIWTLIALDSGDYDIPKASANRTTRAKLIDTIVKSELDGGGFALSGDEADIDITAMALTSLAPYRNEEKVKGAVERGISLLSRKQNNDGGYTAYGNANSESTAQTIIALCTLGIDPDSDARFVKNGHSLIDDLLTYQLADGSFEHVKGEGSNMMATEQALCALAAYYRLTNSLSPLYDMTDVYSFAERTGISEIKVVIDNSQVKFTSYTGRPFIDSASRTQAPIRIVTENLGCSVSWDNAKKLAVITKDDVKVYITAGSNEIVIEKGGKKTKQMIDTTARIIDDRTYIPLRAVVEAVGGEISWQGSSKTVAIEK